MTVLKRFFSIFVTLVFAASATLAAIGDTVTLTGDLFGRTSADFGTKSNIASVVPSGSKATVLETKTMPSGSLGVRVRISSVNGSRGSDTATVGQEVWIYHSKTNPWFSMDGSSAEPTIKPPKAIVVDESEDPNLARNTDPRKTEGDACVGCPTGKTPPSARQNQEDIREVAKVAAKPAPPSKGQTSRSDPSDPWSRFPEINKFMNDSRTNDTIRDAKNNVPAEQGMCYRYVKKSLGANWIKSRYDLTGGEAKNALYPYWQTEYYKDKNGKERSRRVYHDKGDLVKHGWTNMLGNPKYEAILKGDHRNAPKGAIIIYANDHTYKDGKSPYAGHIEIKDSSSRNASYYSFFKGGNFLNSGRAVGLKAAGHPLKVVGIMVKLE